MLRGFFYVRIIRIEDELHELGDLQLLLVDEGTMIRNSMNFRITQERCGYRNPARD